MINVSIVGGSGYAGGELLRILLNHPKVKIKQVTSQRFEGELLVLSHPNLRGMTDLRFESEKNLKKCDLIFVAVPNGVSMGYMRSLLKISGRIIDLGADFRLTDPRIFENWYGKRHQEPILLKKFIYGLPELHRKDLKTARFVACGGCEATAIILALYPLVKEKMLAKDGIIADVKIGSSAAGRKSSSASHHPERHGVLRSYQPTRHRHQAEVEQELGVSLEMTATAVNLVRGILATIHTQAKSGVEEKKMFGGFTGKFTEMNPLFVL